MNNNILSNKKIVKQVSPLIHKELTDEINNMLSYAINNGILINTEVNMLVESKNLNNLIKAHNIMVKNVAPATPKSIKYTKTLLRLDSEYKSLSEKLPLVRNLILLTVFFLVLFIITGLSPYVNINLLDKGILNNSGLPLLLNLSFLASVSGLGILFYLLKRIIASIKDLTFVTHESISYTTQIIFGIITGVIASEVLPFYISNTESIHLYTKIALALIGGFSSKIIFNILQEVITQIKSILIIKTILN